MSGNPSHSEDESQLPSTLSISKFAAARGKEIEIMKKTLSLKSGTKLAFQKLPKHMRRRAMSHNVKRLPRRLREIHLNQMKKSGLPPKQKRPSRKYRRRPYNLMSDYVRRQRKHRWLNTHMWHAKRFHMIEKWGYKLPDRPCDRAFRSCYRASVHHCLLQDISYYNCIEITGDFDSIRSNFKKITDPGTGLTIAAKPFIKGYREGSITIFRNDETKKAIGIIYFQWKPSQINNKHVLWIWIHASYYSEILDTLISCFDLKLNSMETESFNEGLSYTNYDNLELRELKLELSRFRLTGALSNSVLQNCFHMLKNGDPIPDWIKNYYGDTSENQMLLQREHWNSLSSISSPAELTPHMILSVVVLDPRYYLPKKRTKAISEITNSLNCADKLAQICSDGPIWDSSVRKIIKESKISNAQLAEMRRNLLVPGSDLETNGAPIPIMLIQRPGMKNQQNNGYGSGWDIIIPSEWAQPIWISLIMWGARAGGLRESNTIAFYMDQPIHHPDTTAGTQEEHFISNKCKESFFKLPPNKRTNHNKFRIASPMEWKWDLLLKDWDEDQGAVKDFFVLRNKQMLRNIEEILSSSKQIELPSSLYNCLIPVSIKFSNKGLCKQFAIICLPKEGDIVKNPIEDSCLDQNEKLRKEIRKSHKVLLKKLRRRRIRGKKNGKNIPVDLDVLRNYTNKMRKLWLPEPTTIRHSCSREVIGFVRHGDFNFLLGQTKAIGYVAFSALPALVSLKIKNKVLVRNANSRQYRLGTVEVLSK